MNLSNAIAQMITEMLSEQSEIEIQRNVLAQDLGCVPSQINYVLSSRFTPERGYIVESRRGGKGCIRITRVSCDKNTLIMKVIGSIGQTEADFFLSAERSKTMEHTDRLRSDFNKIEENENSQKLMKNRENKR